MCVDMRVDMRTGIDLCADIGLERFLPTVVACALSTYIQTCLHVRTIRQQVYPCLRYAHVCPHMPAHMSTHVSTHVSKPCPYTCPHAHLQMEQNGGAISQFVTRMSIHMSACMPAHMPTQIFAVHTHVCRWSQTAGSSPSSH